MRRRFPKPPPHIVPRAWSPDDRVICPGCGIEARFGDCSLGSAEAINTGAPMSIAAMSRGVPPTDCISAPDCRRKDRIE